jgi:Domain of unknown function (DUF4349)/PKD domain
VNRLRTPTTRTVLLGLAAVIVVGGFALALISNSLPLMQGAFAGPGPYSSVSPPRGDVNQNFGGSIAPQDTSSPSFTVGTAGTGEGTHIISSGDTTITVTSATTTGAAPGQQTSSNLTGGSPPGAGGLIEFSSDLTLRTASPEQAASGIVALAYSVGGYVAYQSTYANAANVVIRVPASQYQQVLGQVEAMGTVVVLTSNSNDVRVQYTDLNATLASLQTEQEALLRLLNESNSINSTLAIETQLQGVNQQINDVESQILQTRTLIQYSTIDVTITESAQQTPLSLTLSATPTNGTSPLSVTFNSIVKGGAQPYVINYNFGDGYAAEGQIVIHTYYQPGTYKVTVSATDQNGTVSQASTTIRVVPPLAQSGLGSFLGYVGGLFVSVVEGIVEVAVVVLPVAAVGAAIVIPIQRRGKAQKQVRQSQ